LHGFFPSQFLYQRLTFHRPRSIDPILAITPAKCKIFTLHCGPIWAITPAKCQFFPSTYPFEKTRQNRRRSRKEWLRTRGAAVEKKSRAVIGGVKSGAAAFEKSRFDT